MLLAIYSQGLGLGCHSRLMVHVRRMWLDMVRVDGVDVEVRGVRIRSLMEPSRQQ